MMDKGPDKAPAASGGGEAKKTVVTHVRAGDINLKRFRIDPCEKNVLVVHNPPYGVSR
ncbi:MAG: hypothetical protein LBT33_03735 [Spirochaetia bacterium]|jgi:hypothetical protein|nr:hypothetical protein [Spirochaetia bacterium]